VVLGLQTDLDDFHGRDDGDCFGDSRGETGEEGAPAADFAVFAGEELLVPFVGCEADGHFGDYARHYCSEAFVQTEGRFFGNNLRSCCDEAASLDLGLR